ncbi:tigger transposable element-derived protein 1-like [Ctenocephalides felis]|uniref:tigger transposable element-derived protein 1-like n=1 Tax=Ctenocephalides felis TaxID=7515 RepID=UPI000E6E3CB4|nr:tigger transposable element-derived protein 1-like [Ctenocephalides felis]
MPPKQDSNNKVKKRVRKSITMEVKSKILKLKDRGYSTSSIGRELNLSRTTVQTILKDKEKLLTALPSVSSNSTIIRKRNALIYEMEKLLYNWIQDQTQRRVPLSLAIIQNKALSIINTLQNKRGENNSDESKCFSASRGWFMRFKTRYSLHNIRVQGEVASADHVAAQSFPGILKEIIESGDYSPKQIFNVDETGLFWKKMPSRTFISQEEKSMPGFKAAKDRLTLLLGSNVEGDLKLKPLLVYRSENPRALKNYVKSTLPVIWKANPKAWVTSILFEEWFTKHFITEVKQYCSNNNLAYKALLILDNAPGHPVRIADIDPQIKVVFLPPNTTSLLQPMDQGVIASFKAYYLRRTFSQAVKANENDGMELRDFWKSYNILQCVKNIATSWNEVTPNNLKGVWKKLCPFFFEPSESSTSTDQPNVDEITTDIVHLANRFPDIAVTTDDIDDLLSSHSQELTDEDLIELEAQVQKEALESQEIASSISDSEKELTLKKLSVAFANLKNAMKIFEENDPNFERSFNVNNKICAAYHCYQDLYDSKKKEAKQSRIDSFFKPKV